MCGETWMRRMMNMTFLLITDHNVRDTLEITDKAIIVSTGQIMIQGTKQQILDSEIAREIYLGKDFSM